MNQLPPSVSELHKKNLRLQAFQYDYLGMIIHRSLQQEQPAHTFHHQ